MQRGSRLGFLYLLMHLSPEFLAQSQKGSAALHRMNQRVTFQGLIIPSWHFPALPTLATFLQPMEILCISFCFLVSAARGWEEEEKWTDPQAAATAFRKVELWQLLCAFIFLSSLVIH